MEDTLMIDMMLYLTIAGRKRKMEFEYELYFGDDCYLIYTDKKYHKYHGVFRVLEEQKALQLLGKKETEWFMSLLNHMDLVKWCNEDGITIAYIKIAEFWYDKYRYGIVAYDTQHYQAVCLEGSNVVNGPSEGYIDIIEQFEMDCYRRQMEYALQKEQNCKGGYDIFDIMLKR